MWNPGFSSLGFSTTASITGASGALTFINHLTFPRSQPHFTIKLAKDAFEEWLAEAMGNERISWARTFSALLPVKSEMDVPFYPIFPMPNGLNLQVIKFLLVHCIASGIWRGFRFS